MQNKCETFFVKDLIVSYKRKIQITCILNAFKIFTF